MPEIPSKITFTRDDVEAGIQSLINNAYVGDVGELDRDDLDEIVRLVLSYATKGIKESAYRAGREDAARAVESMPYQLGDEGWKWLEGKAGEAGWAVEWVSRRRRRDDFTTATIESAYQYGYRRAAEIARGDAQDTPEGREDQNRDEGEQRHG